MLVSAHFVSFAVNNFCFYLNLWCILLMRRKNVDKCFAMSKTCFSLWNDIHDVICNLRCNLFSVSLFFVFFSWQSSPYTLQLWWNFRIKQYTRTTHFWDKQRICFFYTQISQLISTTYFFLFMTVLMIAINILKTILRPWSNFIEIVTELSRMFTFNVCIDKHRECEYCFFLTFKQLFHQNLTKSQINIPFECRLAFQEMIQIIFEINSVVNESKF